MSLVLRALRALALACCLAPGAVRAQEGAARPVETRGLIDPDSMRSPTGMIYYGGTLEVRPDGHMGLAEFPVVTRVDPGSVSERAGLRVGDVLLAVNGRDTRDARPFRRRRGETQWRVRVRRGDREEEIVIEFPQPS